MLVGGETRQKDRLTARQRGSRRRIALAGQEAVSRWGERWRMGLQGAGSGRGGRWRIGTME